MSGLVVWLTGLPSSGKSTLAARVTARLRPALAPVLLDGDELRAALVPTPGYDEPARAAFYETLARLAGLLARQGHVVLVAATAHRRAFRERARALAPAFVEIYMDTPVEECRRRDPKGLFSQSRASAQPLPGAGVTYEPPLNPEFIVRPTDLDPDAAVVERIRARVC
jgi:adenylylsulfate kinase